MKSSIGVMSSAAFACLLSACASGGGGGGGISGGVDTIGGATDGLGGGGGGGDLSITISDPGPIVTTGGAAVYATNTTPAFTDAPIGLTFPASFLDLNLTSSTLEPDDSPVKGAFITVYDDSYRLVVPYMSVDVVLSLNGPSIATPSDGVLSIFGAQTDYAMLGVWLQEHGTSILTSTYLVGYRTADADVPTSGTATYGGEDTVSGIVYTPSATERVELGALEGDSAFTADFATGEISGAFTNMAVTDTDDVTYPWNDISISANFSNSAGLQGSFSGVTDATSSPGNAFALDATADGLIDGYLTGPDADELDAIWTLYDGTRSAVGVVAAPAE